MGKGDSGVLRYSRGFLVILLVIVVWEYVTYTGVVSNLVLPRPSYVITHGLRLFETERFYQNVFQTMTSWLMAFVSGMIIGLLLGFSTGVSNNFELLVLPISAFVRSIPPIALFPIFLILIGPGKLPIVIVGIIFVAIYVFPIAAQSTEAAKVKFLELSQILNLSRLEFIQTIIIPATFISSLVASRLAASFLFAIIVAGEIMIGGNRGVGAAISEYSQKYMLEESYFYILLTGLMGLNLDLILSFIQSRNAKKMFL
jgi:sulfonate transport system permease protein